MAMVTPEILTALETGFKKNFQDAFGATRADADFDKVATTITSTSKSNTYGWLGKFPKMREWIGERQLKNMQAYGYSIFNKDFEATVDVDRNDIEDDNIGIYGPLMQEMGHSAGEQPDELVFGLLGNGRSELCYDGQYFFDTDHPGFDKDGNATTVSNINDTGSTTAPWWYLLDASRPLKPIIFQERKKPEFVTKTDPNTSDKVFMEKKFLYGADARCNVGYGLWQLAYASNADLTSANLQAAIKAMRSLKDSNGRPIKVTPNLLVVGPTLSSAANKVVKMMLAEGGASNETWDVVEVLDTQWVE